MTRKAEALAKLLKMHRQMPDGTDEGITKIVIWENIVKDIAREVCGSDADVASFLRMAGCPTHRPPVLCG
jgi:hypothetical protein